MVFVAEGENCKGGWEEVSVTEGMAEGRRVQETSFFGCSGLHPSVWR